MFHVRPVFGSAFRPVQPAHLGRRRFERLRLVHRLLTACQFLSGSAPAFARRRGASEPPGSKTARRHPSPRFELTASPAAPPVLRNETGLLELHILDPFLNPPATGRELRIACLRLSRTLVYSYRRKLELEPVRLPGAAGHLMRYGHPACISDFA